MIWNEELKLVDEPLLYFVRNLLDIFEEMMENENS